MGIVNGIKSCINAVGDAVKSVADKIKSFLHFSVPDEGPLTEYESWMPDFMNGLAKGIEKSKGVVAKAVEGVTDEMMINPLKATSKVEVVSKGGAASDSRSESYGSTSITIQQMVVRNDDDIRRISQELNSLMQSGRRARGLI